MTLFAILLLCSTSFPTTHIYWYKAVERGYNLQQSDPGPGIPAGAVIHEGITASGSIAQHTGAQSGVSITFGSGLDDAQGRCGFFWSKDLCDAAGTVTRANLRAEFRDGWCGNALCNAGPIDIRCGVADFAGNFVDWEYSVVPESQDWQDFLNPLGYSMGYNLQTPTLGAEEIIHYTAPAGRRDQSSPSVLDGQFFEIDVTDQINFILTNPGEHAVVLLVNMGTGSTGKVQSYAEEGGASSLGACPSDAPWTRDANTAHLWTEGDVVISSENRMVAPKTKMGTALQVEGPHPFKSRAVFSFSTGITGWGILKIFDASGRRMFETRLKGNGSATWEPLASMPAGIYLACLTSGTGRAAIKIIREK